MKYLDIHYYLHLLDVVLQRPQAKRGLIPYKLKGTDERYSSGKATSYLGASIDILIKNGNYIQFRPIGEHQQEDAMGESVDDKMDCTGEAITNGVEEIMLAERWLVETNQATSDQIEKVKIYKHFGLIYQLPDGKWNADISQRMIAKLSGTTRQGNRVDRVIDAVRLYGFVPDKMWPRVKDWDEYYKIVPPEVIDHGKMIAGKENGYLEITYQWASPRLAKETLKKSPLPTPVYAWNGKNGDVFIRTAYPFNHLTLKDAYIPINWQIFDSYDESGDYGKKLANDFSFGTDLMIHIHLKKKLITNDNNMATNVKILKDKNSAQVGFYLPQTNEDAMISIAKNFDIELPIKDGKLDWESVNIAGEFELR